MGLPTMSFKEFTKNPIVALLFLSVLTILSTCSTRLYVRRNDFRIKG